MNEWNRNIGLIYMSSYCCSVTLSFLTLWPRGLQHASPPCPSLSTGVCSNSCPLSWWCHPAISSSAAPFSSCSQSSPDSVFYQVGSSHQVAKVFRSFSISPSKECSDSISFRRLTGLICLQSKGCSRVFFSTTFCKHQLFGAQLSLRSNSDIHTWLLEKQYLWLPW